jgi:hypothetical protein
MSNSSVIGGDPKSTLNVLCMNRNPKELPKYETTANPGNLPFVSIVTIHLGNQSSIRLQGLPASSKSLAEKSAASVGLGDPRVRVAFGLHPAPGVHQHGSFYARCNYNL